MTVFDGLAVSHSGWSAGHQQQHTEQQQQLQQQQLLLGLWQHRNPWHSSYHKL